MMRYLAYGSHSRFLKALVAAAALLAVLAGARPALASPGFERLTGPPAGLGIPARDPQTPAWHAGSWYSAIVGPQLVVERYDARLEAWQPVGGPLNHDIAHRAQLPALLDSRRGALVAAWVEDDPAHGPQVVASRLVESPSGRATWERMGGALPAQAARPSLVDVDGNVWLVFTDPNGEMRFAHFAADSWQVLPARFTTGTPGNFRVAQAVEHDGDIYVGFRALVRIPYRVGGVHQDEVEMTLAGAVRLRVRGAAEPTIENLGMFGDLDRGVTAVRVSAGADGIPLLAWREPASGEDDRSRPRVVVYRLADRSNEGARIGNFNVGDDQPGPLLVTQVGGDTLFGMRGQDGVLRVWRWRAADRILTQELQVAADQAELAVTPDAGRALLVVADRNRRSALQYVSGGS